MSHDEQITLDMVEYRRRTLAAALRSAQSDVTAPVLTSPFALPFGDTSGHIGVVTDEANGTLYYVVTTSATPPSKAQVKAGEDHSGAAAAASGSQAIGSTGAKTATPTGLSSNTLYYSYWMHEDAVGNQSDVKALTSFTTLTTGTSDTSFDNLIAAASVAPTDFRKGLIARLIGALYAGSIWSKIDAMWVLAAHDEQFGRLNWIDPGTFTLTAVNSPTFTTDRGFAGDGSTSYLDTGWDAANNGVQLTQNDAHISSYQRTGGGSTFASFVQQTNGVRLGVMSRGNANQNIAYVNSSTSVPSSSTASTLPQHLLGRRNDGTNASAVRDGVSMGAPSAAASGSPLTTDLSFGKAGTIYISAQMAGGSVGAYFDDTECAAFYAAWHDYMVALGADT